MRSEFSFVDRFEKGKSALVGISFSFCFCEDYWCLKYE